MSPIKDSSKEGKRYVMLILNTKPVIIPNAKKSTQGINGNFTILKIYKLVLLFYYSFYFSKSIFIIRF